MVATRQIIETTITHEGKCDLGYIISNVAITLYGPRLDEPVRTFGGTMILYGTAILAICVLVGKTLGVLFGQLLGIDADIGGVGFAMILLIIAATWLQKKNLMPKPTERGLLFWSSMYIPIVVAMAATQNVAGALSGGPMAILAGLGTFLVCMLIVPGIARLGPPSEPLPPITAAEEEEH